MPVGVKGREKTNPTSSSLTSPKSFFFFFNLFITFFSKRLQDISTPPIPPSSWFLESRCAVGQAWCW